MGFSNEFLLICQLFFILKNQIFFDFIINLNSEYIQELDDSYFSI